MKKTPLVSVAIPCHNYAEYVEQAVLSVINQTYHNVELVVINDGSSDKSHEVITRLQAKYNFQYVNQLNKGIIETRNLAVSLASGDYQMQLDADDYLDHTYIEKCVAAAEESGAGIVYTQAHVFGRADFITEYTTYDIEKLKHDNYIHASSLIRSAILPESPYDPYLNDKGYEDWDVFLDLCLDGAKAMLVDEPLLYYRKHADRKSRSDEFADVYKEMLVRHHIWSKQNAKHPDEFWYFSSQISTLLQMIHMRNQLIAQIGELEGQGLEKSNRIEQLTGENNSLRLRVARLEMRDPITIAKKIKRRLLR